MFEEHKSNFFKNNLNQEARTLVDLLFYLDAYQASDTAFIFLDGTELECRHSITYHELHSAAIKIALKLRQTTKAGDRALLIYSSGLDFIIGFFACLYAGLVAVPIYPPRMKRGTHQQLKAVYNNASPSVILSESTFLDLLQNVKECVDLDIPWIFTDEILSSGSSNVLDYSKPEIDENSLALLQYTSGSTGSPKGVMVTHGNLLHNQKMIKESFGHHEATIVAGWLPFYHDMGLIGNILQPLYIGRPCILMSPMSFLQRPYVWLKVISDYRVSTSGGPSFAYDLCTKISDAEKKSLDLSSWEVAFNGSEPVRAEVITKFSDKFASCGFKKHAFYPCYGMAEATLLVSGGLKDKDPVVKYIDKTELARNQVKFSLQNDATCTSITGCGFVRDKQQLIIVSPEDFSICKGNEVGEIWLQGASIAKGYWNNPEKTEEIFKARVKSIADTQQSQDFLRTGDLGFVHENEVYVTGRLKELIIIRGRNYYPHDIEAALKTSHPLLQNAQAAAISVEVDENERLVILQEIERSLIKHLPIEEVLTSIQAVLSKEFDLAAYAILLLKPGQIPKTSSGKTKRFLCAKMFLENSFETIKGSDATFAIRREEQVEINTPNQGADSVASASDAKYNSALQQLKRTVLETQSELITEENISRHFWNILFK